MPDDASPATDMRRELGWRDLVFFHVTAILSMRWIAKAAASGSGSLGLWALAGLCFFLPAARAVTDLARAFPEQGGIYRWSRAAFGPRHGVLCAWCYVVSNLVYFPALLTVVVDWLLAAVGWSDPGGGVRLAASLTCLWAVLVVNLLGLRVGRYLQALCAWALWLPLLVLILLVLVLLLREGSRNELWPLLPGRLDLDTGKLWSSLCFGFAGLELASSMGAEIRDPRNTVPRSIRAAGVVVASLYIAGTTALLVAVPRDGIDGVTGVRMGLAAVLGDGAPLLLQGVLLLLALGGLGAVSAWLSATARIPYAVGLDRHMPPALARVHPRLGTPHVALLWQGAIATVVTLVAAAGASEEGAYAVLNDATTVVYFVPYCYLFLSHLRLVPELGARVGAVVGLLATLASVGLALVPPADSTEPWLFVAKVAGGSAVLVLLAVPICRNRARAPA